MTILSNDILKMGIIGCGLIGNKRAAVIKNDPTSVLRAASDVNIINAAVSLKQCGAGAGGRACRDWRDWRDMLDKEKLDAVAERLLRDGHKVIGIDNLAYGLRSNIPEGVDFHQLDIRGKEMYPLFTGTDAVFHFAAKNCIADCQADPVETADINVRGTVNVFEAARLGGVHKVIYAESSAIYEGAKTYPTPETDEAPESFYAMSKMASKYFAEAYQRFYGTPSAGTKPPSAGGQQPITAYPHRWSLSGSGLKSPAPLTIISPGAPFPE